MASPLQISWLRASRFSVHASTPLQKLTGREVRHPPDFLCPNLMRELLICQPVECPRIICQTDSVSFRALRAPALRSESKQLAAPAFYPRRTALSSRVGAKLGRRRCRFARLAFAHSHNVAGIETDRTLLRLGKDHRDLAASCGRLARNISNVASKLTTAKMVNAMA